MNTSDINAPLIFRAEMEKNATYEMPQDVNLWDEEVLKHLNEEFPDLVEENIEVVFKKTDAKKGYGYGFIALGEKGKIKIPIIIKEYQMSPLDVMLYEGKSFPLTTETVKEIVQSTAIGKTVAKPEEPFAYVGPNITERVYPGLYSVFRPGLGGRVSAYKYASVLSEISKDPDQVEGLRERLKSDPTLVAAWANSECKEVLKKAASGEVAVPCDPRGEYNKANADEVKPGQAHPLVDAFIKRVEGDKPSGPVVRPGIYDVEGQSGHNYRGFVFPQVFDFDMQKQDVMVFVGAMREPDEKGNTYDKGTFSAVQQTIVGKPTSDTSPGKYSGDGCYLSAGDKGVFFIRKGEGPAIAFMPVKVTSVTKMNERRETDFNKNNQTIKVTRDFVVKKYNVIDSLGRSYILVISPSAINVQRVGNMVMMPGDTSFVNFGTLINLRKDAAQVTKVAALKTATMRHLGGQSFSIDASWAEDWAREGDLQSRLQPYLESFYTKESLEKCFSECRKSSRLSIHDRAAAPVVEQAKVACKDAHRFARDLTKEAAALKDPGLVDTVLSLQFINKDNVNKFIAFIPQFEQAASHLADLLVASRLGLPLQEYPVKTAMENLMEVLSGLRMLRGK